MKPKSHFKYFICSNCGATASGNPSQAPICCGNSMLEISREIHDQQAEANKAAYRIKSQQEARETIPWRGQNPLLSDNSPDKFFASRGYLLNLFYALG